MNDLFQQIEDLIMPVLQTENVELVDLQVSGSPQNRGLKIYIDSENGVSLEKCSEVSRAISDQLDMVDVFNGKYLLEISSPGVSRPLIKATDFSRNLNRSVEIVYDENGEQKDFQGIIKEVTDVDVSILTEGKSIRILLSQIKNGKLILPW